MFNASEIFAVGIGVGIVLGIIAGWIMGWGSCRTTMLDRLKIYRNLLKERSHTNGIK